MKNLPIIIALFFVSLAFAQKSSDKNVFNEAEKTQNNQSTNKGTNPGGPGDPVPVDNYIPALFLVGTAIIAYRNLKLKAL